MTVSELIEFLAQLPPDMEVVGDMGDDKLWHRCEEDIRVAVIDGQEVLVVD